MLYLLPALLLCLGTVICILFLRIFLFTYLFVAVHILPIRPRVGVFSLVFRGV